MDNITREVLSWNFKQKRCQETYYKAQSLPDFFISSLEYKKKFEPLFFEEFRAQIKRFLEIKPTLIEGLICKVIFYQKKFGRFFFAAEIEESSHTNLRKGDLLILSNQKNPQKKKRNILNNFGIISANTFKVKQEILIETNFNFWKKITKTKINSGQIFIRKISNLMNHIREYIALSSFCDTFPVYKRLIFPVLIPTKQFEYKKKDPTLENHLDFHFNQSQIEGITSAFTDGITLIQGPPGTGKTRTILGIISLVSKNNQKKEIPKVFPKKNFEFEKIVSSLNFQTFFPSTFFLNPNDLNNWRKNSKKKIHLKKKKTQKIVICAPSNAAIDENTTRTTLGFPFQSSKIQRVPFKILRLGPNYSSILDHLSLENYALVWASEHDLNIRFRIHSKIFQRARFEIMKKSSMVYTTLACTGYSIIKQIYTEETVIIDEAAQAVELSTLIPFKQNSKRIILVGDVQQLPATVFSKTSVDFEYDRSLFKRLQLRKHPVWFLETQYRMHPQISSFPARKFYQNGLKDSQESGRTVKFHALRCFGPLIFFDICESLEQNHLNQLSAWCNLDEVRVTSLLLRALLCLYTNFNSYSVGIIAGYNGQIKEFQNYKINRKHNFEGQINTVDGFQGKEKDIIFLSCVRARMEMGIGFLSDCRRINVAFTRARFGFWTIGNSGTLANDINWREAIVDLKKRKRFFCIRKPFERSSRRLVYWSFEDSCSFSLDGDFYKSVPIQLLEYLSNKI